MGMFKYLNPLRPFAIAATNINRSFSSVRSIAVELKEGRAARINRLKVAEADTRSPTDRFQEAMEAGKWSEKDLPDQIKALHRARYSFLVIGIVTFCLIMFTGFNAPWWWAALLAPCAFSFVGILIIISAKHAWWAWQIEKRSLLPFADFFSSPEFWKRTFLL